MKIAIWDNGRQHSDHEIIFLDGSKYSQGDMEEAFRFHRMASPYEAPVVMHYGTGDFPWFNGFVADLKEVLLSYAGVMIDWEDHPGEEEKFNVLVAKLSP